MYEQSFWVQWHATITSCHIEVSTLVETTSPIVFDRVKETDSTPTVALWSLVHVPSIKLQEMQTPLVYNESKTPQKACRLMWHPYLHVTLT